VPAARYANTHCPAAAHETINQQRPTATYICAGSMRRPASRVALGTASNLPLRKRTERALREAGRLHSKWTIEASPEILEGDRGHKLDELRRCELMFEPAKEVDGHVRRRSCDGDAEIQDEFLDLRESGAVGVPREVLQLIL